ncbi:hypothetical protein ATI61_10632 [Archangium gephyra]|uniref:1,4-alpha-glucan branching enzyme n=1 Tax=Archangium gephyra TaxID=48 RepID=A0AAC8TAC3_9BACT|nr:hypothetical protein [Archangium gephyra]AKI98631.1 1,4-alpha-glucan branching enzyme [Archangium gephyra]REG30563.1 hypothetical protein ATI61_10632 [Archangium gephyra]
MTTKSSHVTIDHEEIRQWAELRCGRPSMVTGTGEKGHAGILRIDFPGYGGRGTLEPISWEEFFEKFEENKLALVYSAHAHGHRSNFNKLIARETVDLETGDKVGPSRHRRKQAEAAVKRSTTPRRTTRSAPAASGERRTPRSAAARTVRETGPDTRTPPRAAPPKGRGSQRGGARQNPERRGSSRGGGSRGR